ncbi:hypothetical protein B0H19DRAFT_1375305 [Mycena capillaripes]|nr:hypothetical protein B0H19DRAFT_1375305 [Mycena capillaripes]
MSVPPVPTQESYLVIGGGISLGEHIVEELLRRGERRVAIFDALPLAAEQTKRFGPAVRVCVGDVLLPESIAEALKVHETTCIIHTGMVSMRATQAARYPEEPQPPQTPADQKEEYKAIEALHRKLVTDGMRNVLAAALESAVTQLVYCGNADILLEERDRPMLREADAPYPPKLWDEGLEPQSHAERMVRSFNGVNALRTAVIRPAKMFGCVQSESCPRDRSISDTPSSPGWAMAKTLRQLKANPRVAGVATKAENTPVDRTYVANAAHAAILASDRLNPAHPQHAATAGNAFFITDGEPRPFCDFLPSLWVATGGVRPQALELSKGALLAVAGVKDVLGMWRGEKARMWKTIKMVHTNRTYDIGLAREVLGYAPILSHDEGIQQVAEWWLGQQLKISKEKAAISGGSAREEPPPYDHKEATEKNPFF